MGRFLYISTPTNRSSIVHQCVAFSRIGILRLTQTVPEATLYFPFSVCFTPVPVAILESGRAHLSSLMDSREGLGCSAGAGSSHGDLLGDLLALRLGADSRSHR